MTTRFHTTPSFTLRQQMPQSPPAYTTDTQRWSAVQRRDRAADGRFFYSVSTTGIFCRPSCPSRHALRQHVSFHDTAAAAQQAGFRPCLRCQPTGASLQQRHADAAVRACRIIESADTPPTLEELAHAVGLSPHHLHRVFRAAVGATPRQYAAAHRTRRVQSSLRREDTVTDAIFEAGYRTTSRFYSHAGDALGMTPSTYRSGGKDELIHYVIRPCPLGLVLVAGTERGLCMVAFGDARQTLAQELKDAFPKATIEKGTGAFDAWVTPLVQEMTRPSGSLGLPLDIRGTAFQQRVWQALRDIPAGQVATYADVAARIGQPRAVRAVANACASNRLALVVPCHRVVPASGGTGGYRWGTQRKQHLLRSEGAPQEPA